MGGMGQGEQRGKIGLDNNKKKKSLKNVFYFEVFGGSKIQNIILIIDQIQ